MPSCNHHIQKLIDHSHSLTEICNIIRQNYCKCTTKENYKINRKYFAVKTCFEVQLNDLDDPLNSTILVSFNGGNKKPIEDVMFIISNLPLISREYETCIKLNIIDCKIKMSPRDVNTLASKYASFLEFIFYHFPNVTSFEIKSYYNDSYFHNFPIYVLEKLVSDQIEEISYIELFSLLNYGKEFNLLDSEIFDNKSNLNKFFFYADINKFSYTRENFNNELDAFLKLLSKHKHITYSFSIALNDLSMKIAYKIAEYCEENTIHFQFCFCKPITGVSYFDYFDLDEKVLQIKSYITCIKMYLREFKCFKKLEIALSSLEELESIIINIDYNFTAYVVKEFGNCKNFFRKLDNNIFLRIVTKNLKKLEISFIENQDINKKGIKHYDKKSNKILAKLLSYFPNSVRVIMFENINKIEKFVFIQMGFYFPQLKTITFKGINEISDVACVKIKSLRNVIIYGELKIEIPPWIDIVIFRYCHCQNMLQYKTSDLKNIDYYFNLMNTRFDCSLQKIDDGETVEIIFLRDVLNWNNFIKL